ncbi:methyltransferase domain-containing protein [Colletotrichum lupini]|uniref:Methyltransferase domain-containing protein n=1 Tax=Colletotrichum lupini TaxID=145971 RepID=A0A9Q8WA58_9PEZI|nr:methyltransferase domain-containing protein [Colletotrichum lupini]UQC75849.1 methyltransferase domain-containing protein [Colletotrichum lupini]
MTERVPDAMHQIDIVFPHGTNVDLEPDEVSTRERGLRQSEAWPSSTASLRSSIVRAREENGRIYHGYKDGKYVLPTDQEELDRQGEAHPEAEVVGVDLSPVQPGFTPPNVHYEIDDLEEEWSFSRKFDYVHSNEVSSNLNPGGWFEIQDIDFPMRCDDETIPPDCDLGRWNELMMEAGQRSGFLLDTCGRAAEMMASVGFVDIVRIQFKWPINQWPRDVKHKTLGVWTEANFSVGLESMTLALFTRFMGWRKEEVWDFSANVIAEWRDASGGLIRKRADTNAVRPSPSPVAAA